MKDELRALGEPYSATATNGLRALRGEHRSCVEPASPRRITGSIDLDATLASHPDHLHANRWDYGVGFRLTVADRRCAVWIEIHPANPGAVAVMIRKAQWLRNWLRQHPTIEALTRNGMEATSTSAMYWVPTGRDTVSKGSQSFRKLATAGITKARRVSLP